jgi:hypothetical protein
LVILKVAIAYSHFAPGNPDHEANR